MLQEEEDRTAQAILERLSDLSNHTDDDEEIVPYREFEADEKTYYFTPGGFLYRKELGSEKWGDYSAATSPMRCGTTGPMTGRP